MTGLARATSLVVAALVALAGCAAIPTSGPVTEVVDDSGFGQSTVRYSPALPAEGATPGEVVRGFLDAMLAYPSSTRTAAAFLTPEAAATWDRQEGVTVYRGAQVASPARSGPRAVDTGDGSKVRLDLDETGRLDAQGRYSAGRGAQDMGYDLERVDGQWRIADPQPGLLVTDKFFADYFRPFDLFFFDRPAQRLTPQPVHLLVDDRLAAALIAALARGGDSSQARSFVPALDDLRATVPVGTGVADVGFTAGSRDDSDVERLSAQVIWTLRQVPGISDVRISVGSRPVEPHGSPEQPIDSWDEFGAGPAREQAHALRGDRVVEIDDGEVAPIDGPWGDDAGGASAVALTGDRIALVDDGRSSIRIADRDGAVQRTLIGSGVLDPTTDVDDRFWVVDRPGGRTRVRTVADGVTTISPGPLAALDVRSLDISPDGSRYVVTVGAGGGATVRVGRVLRDADGVVTGLGSADRIGLDAAAPRSAVWSDNVRVSFLAASDAGIQVQTALIDGSTVSGESTGGRALLPDVDAARLVVGSGPDPATYATDPRGRLWYLGAGGSWRLVDSGAVRSLGYED